MGNIGAEICRRAAAFGMKILGVDPRCRQVPGVLPEVWPPGEKPSILVNGHGPAMHDARVSRKIFPEPASSVAEPALAFHLPFGEQGGLLLQGTLPLFTTSKVFVSPPTFTSVMLLTV